MSCQEVAQNFKEQGNEYFKGKRFREALGFYTQGIDAKPADVALEEALLCNRAACNLTLGMLSYIVHLSIRLTCGYRKLRFCLA